MRLNDGRIRLAEIHWLKRTGLARRKWESNATLIKAMSRRVKAATKFAVCIQSDDADLLTPRMIYRILPDENAAKSDYVRVVDNEGEDYLYPAKYFMFLDLPRELERALTEAA